MALTVKALRERAGLSQVQVAEAMGVSQRTVSRWEQANDPGAYWTGFRRQDGSRQRALCVVLDVNEPYPAAPFEPCQRRAWFDARNEQLAAKVGARSSGGPPKAA